MGDEKTDANTFFSLTNPPLLKKISKGQDNLVFLAPSPLFQLRLEIVNFLLGNGHPDEIGLEEILHVSQKCHGCAYGGSQCDKILNIIPADRATCDPMP